MVGSRENRRTQPFSRIGHPRYHTKHVLYHHSLSYPFRSNSLAGILDLRVPLTRVLICDITFTRPGPPRRRYSKAVVVLTYAVGPLPDIEHGAFRFYYLPLHSLPSRIGSRQSVIIGHLSCGSVQAALAAVTSSPPPQVEPVLQHWLTLLVWSSQRYSAALRVQKYSQG